MGYPIRVLFVRPAKIKTVTICLRKVASQIVAHSQPTSRQISLSRVSWLGNVSWFPTTSNGGPDQVVNRESKISVKDSERMARVRQRNTSPELAVRSCLHRLGYRFRLHCRDLPGTPDIVLPKHRKAIFVHGCFWHCHECHLFKWPKSNAAFWRKKILGNRHRDARNVKELRKLGWHVMTVWECAVRSKSDAQLQSLAKRMATWIEADVERYRSKNFT